MSHTSGPWVVRGGSYGLPEVWTSDENTCITDRVFNDNAHLIAAAPELLEALKTIDVLMDNIRNSQGWADASLCCGPRVHEAQDLARAAIAKATGND